MSDIDDDIPLSKLWGEKKGKKESGKNGKQTTNGKTTATKVTTPTVKKEKKDESPAPVKKEKKEEVKKEVKKESNGSAAAAKKVKTEPAALNKSSSAASAKSSTSLSNNNGKSKSTSNLNGAAATKTPVKTEPKNEPRTPSASPVKSASKATPTASKAAAKGKKRGAQDADIKTESESPKKRKKKEEEEEVWRWWEEKKYEDGRKWTKLEHKGPLFEPPYVPLPESIKFYYNGEVLKLRNESEEVMTFYAKMLDHDYTKKDIFNENFFRDWRTYMSEKERAKITDLKKCDFTKVFEYFKQKSEERKNMSKEEKKAIKEENQKVKEKYGTCTWDGHKQPIANYKIEPPGLFRGRGEHPKMGMVKKRIQPEDVIINGGKDSNMPKAPDGHKWKEVRHDNKVAWLCSWTENVQGNIKYVMLNAASRVKGERDWQKYEKARKLHRIIDKVRNNYTEDWKAKEMKIRQRAVAIYFIDKLALRAGNEKDEDEADTVGCCSLRVEHVKLHKHVEDVGDYVVEFDFLGKDSIRYQNKVPVDKRVYKNLKLFMENKNDDDELFDRLNTTILNAYLNECMDGLSAKVFRTYNASRTLQEQLDKLTSSDDSIADKILSYNRANRAVAILCNHQRSVPKTFAKSMENMQTKIQQKKDQITEAEKEFKAAKADLKSSKTVAAKKKFEQKENAVVRLKDQLKKLEIQTIDKQENKDIALGTSKLNYLDPRISVAWCKKEGVPIEKVYSKTQRDKFRWAIDMATPEYHFFNYDGEIQLRDLAYLDEMEAENDGTQDDTTCDPDAEANGEQDEEDDN